MTARAGPKVLLIGGWGRSGSTLLNDMLGNVDGVFGAGELRGIFGEMLPESEESVCSCGRNHAECPFWRAVFDESLAGADDAYLRELARFDATRLRMRPREMVMLRGMLHTDAADEAHRHAEHLSRLYRGIEHVAGASLIVDSSKAPPYLWLVASLAQIRPYVLHLVRDPRAAAYSWRRRAIYDWQAGPMKSSAYWISSNAILERVLRRRGEVPYRVLRYEDFMAEPRRCFDEVLRWVGHEAKGLRWTGERSIRLRPHHTMGGNPSRFTHGQIALRTDDAWRAEMKMADKVAATLPALPLLRRYGYSVRV